MSFSSSLQALGKWLRQLVSAIVAELLRERKKPRKVRPVGGDPETRDAIDDSIAREADDDADTD